jgi:hypothetical protein
MKLSDLKTLDQVIDDHRQDEDFRAEWDRTAFAREVELQLLVDSVTDVPGGSS